MHYTILSYTSDLTDPAREFIPIGVLVADERTNEIMFRRLPVESLPEGYKITDPASRLFWEHITNSLQIQFADYARNPQNEYYRQRLGEQYGFLEQLAYEWRNTNLQLSPPLPLEQSGSLSDVVSSLYRENVPAGLNQG